MNATNVETSPKPLFQRERSLSKRRWAEVLFSSLLRVGTYCVILTSALIFLQIGWKGGKTVFQTQAPFVNMEFLTGRPSTLHVFEWEGRTMEMGDEEYRAFRQKHGDVPGGAATYAHSAGGILPCLIGTILLVAGAMVIALVLGVSSAIYMSEYAREGKGVRLVRLAIVNLAGVPSIVFGLFGMGLFVIAFGWNVSLLAGWFTLAFMVLPVIITASEEALRAVPQGLREASLALGATKWQTIRTNVLPYAIPGILTSSILGVARVAGETAPIMFTAAYVVRDSYPWEVEKWTDFFFQPVMALPYHIYVVSSKIPQNEYTERVQYGTAFVFLFVVMAMALGSVVLRARYRRNLKW